MANRPHAMPSPNPFADPYDPYDAPVEMSNLRQPADAHGSRDMHRADSPDVSPPHSRSASPTGPSARGLGRSMGAQYTPISPLEHGQATQSASPSLITLGSLQHYKTMDAAAQRLVDRRVGEIAEWHIHWITPALIIGTFVAGVMGAMGHHLFYVRLDGEPAEDQLKMVRYGTALAFFVKSTLVGCVIMCYRQRIWHTFRKKAMTIMGIDGLFSATEDPTQFFYNWEMITNGKLATLMAVCSWLIPLASVLSPSALTSEVRETFNSTTCPTVAALNFEHEAVHDFRKETDYPGSSLVYYNTTDTEAKAPGFFDYYDQPSKNARRLAITSMYLRKPATNPDASLLSCGERWNCTYDITFQAPGYNCDEIANLSHPDPGPGAPFNLSILAPLGTKIYYANVNDQEYKRPQVETNDKGMPADGPPYPDMLGVFQSEPVLWIGHSVKTSMPYNKSSPYAAKWETVHEPKIFKCVSYYTKYTFEMKYNDTVQSHHLKSREFIKPLINTTITTDESKDSINDVIAQPSNNFVRPSDSKVYKETASYHAMGQLVRNFLSGEVFRNDSKGYIVTKSDISETRLMDPITSYPTPNLMDEVQNVFQDMLITLLSEPHLVVADNQTVACIKSRSVNVFVYHRQGLWIGYSLAVTFTFGSMLAGAYAMWKNGVASDTLFSRIMVTTRNPTLDRLSVGACLGGDPFPKDLTKTKLKFGVLLEEEPREGPLGKVEHCCFGSAGEVKEIVKHGTYAGLRKYRKEADDEIGDFSEKEALLQRLE